MKKRILFVCLGNICRSPMAEAVMRHQVKLAQLSEQIEVDSAGTGDWHVGHPLMKEQEASWMSIRFHTRACRLA